MDSAERTQLAAYLRRLPRFWDHLATQWAKTLASQSAPSPYWNLDYVCVELECSTTSDSLVVGYYGEKLATLSPEQWMEGSEWPHTDGWEFVIDRRFSALAPAETLRLDVISGWEFRVRTFERINQFGQLVDSLLESARQLVRSRPDHVRALRRIRNRVLVVDDFGDIQEGGWKNEMDSYIHAKLVPNLGVKLTSEQSADLKMIGLHSLLAEIVHEAVTDFDAEVDSQFNALFAAANDGRALEDFCISFLVRRKWLVERTGGPGDQGADIIATRDGCRIAVQCKAYAGAVGNGAVQEVWAAKHYFEAHTAIVVSTGTFTQSAKDLAAGLGVRLVRPDDLERVV